MEDVDIVIRSYSRDFRWLGYCLDAVRRWCSGFRQVVVVVPERSKTRLSRWGLRPDCLIVCCDYPDDYLGQQVTKLYADHVTDAALIAHLDSDCIIRGPLRPADLCDEHGLPRMVITPTSCFRGRGPWQDHTERFLGWPVSFDYMRSQPLLYPRWLYPQLRRHARARHGVALDDYVLNQGPLGFSEFNALGAYAHRHHPDAFAWQISVNQGYEETHARVFWSWEGITPATERELVGLTRNEA
ncbi:MAG: hypothetical protein WBC33_11645 [Conexibacter sp.]